MATPEVRMPLQPGDPAPDFSLPAADREGAVSLADYRGKSPLLLAMFRGLYCAFCRRHAQQLGVTREKLLAEGVETLAIVGSRPERARLYYRYRPPRVPVAADPDLTAHRAYGVPNREMTPEVWQVIRSKYAELAGELQVPGDQVKSEMNRRDGFEPTPADDDEMGRHGAQFIGQFLIDRGGIIRWVNIECAKDGLAGMQKFPTDEELLAAARTL